MSDSEDFSFEAEYQDAFDCVPTPVGAIKKGKYCMLRGKPCRVTEYCISKPGKHGAAKASIVGVDIFTGKKYEDGGPTSSNIFVPNVSKREYIIQEIEQGFASLRMDEKQELKENVRLPVQDKNLFGQIIKNLSSDRKTLVTVISACGQQRIIETRTK